MNGDVMLGELMGREERGCDAWGMSGKRGTGM